MCFSAAASFTAGAALTGAGAGSLWVARDLPRGVLPLAAMPGLFAVHQFAEGMTWQRFHDAGRTTLAADMPIYVYVFIAFVLWAVWLPLGVRMVEQVAWRRRLLEACIVIGSLTAAYHAWSILSETPTATALVRGVSYDVHAPALLLTTFPYLIATTGACLLSSIRPVRMIGVIWFIAACAAFAMVRTETFASTWCMFSAVVSAGLLAWLLAERRAASGSLATDVSSYR